MSFQMVDFYFLKESWLIPKLNRFATNMMQARIRNEFKVSFHVVWYTFGIHIETYTVWVIS